MRPLRDKPDNVTGFPQCNFPKWCAWKICKTGCFFAGKCGWKEHIKPLKITPSNDGKNNSLNTL